MSTIFLIVAVVLIVLAIVWIRFGFNKYRIKNIPVEKPESPKDSKDKMLGEEYLVLSDDGAEIVRKYKEALADSRRLAEEEAAYKKGAEVSALKIEYYKTARQEIEERLALLRKKAELMEERKRHPNWWRRFWRNRREESRQIGERVSMFVHLLRYLITAATMVATAVAIIVILFKQT
jgi:hypothetical protein